MAFFVALAAAWVAGAWALRRVAFAGTVEALTYRLLAGACICAVGIMAVGSASLRATQVALYVAALAGLGYELFFRPKMADVFPGRPEKPAPLDGFERLYLAAMGVSLFLALVSALAPVTSWDATVAHIALPQAYAREGCLRLFEGNAYSAYPHFVHSVFAYAFFESGEVGVTLLNWGFGVLGCAALFVLGNRIEGRRCGLIAAAMYAVAPILMDQVGASLDLAFGAVSLGALAAFITWYENERDEWLALAALLAGSSCGIRHTGYIVCVLLALGALTVPSSDRREAVQRFGWLALLAASPWLLRSFLLTGNPVYPFFSSWLSANGVPAEETATFGSHSSIRGLDLKALVMFPWNLIMRPTWYDGWSRSPGGLLLFLGVPGLFVGNKRVPWLAAYSIGGGFCFFFFQQSARYLLPFFLPMMVVAGVAACRLPVFCVPPETLRHASNGRSDGTASGWWPMLVRALRRAVFPPYQAANFLLGKAIPLLLVAAFAYGLAFQFAAMYFKIPVVIGLEEREAYLDRRVERHAAFRWANEHLANAGTILTLDPRAYYLKIPSYQNYEALKFLSGKRLGEQLQWLDERGITHVLIPKTYVDETPALVHLGIKGVLERWSKARRFFVPVETFDLVRPRNDGLERVEIYEVRFPR